MTPTTYTELVTLILDLINIVITTLFAVMFIYFMWKMIDAWVINAGEERRREEGKQYAVSAVFAFVVMISTWGIVILVKKTLFG